MVKKRMAKTSISLNKSKGTMHSGNEINPGGGGGPVLEKYGMTY